MPNKALQPAVLPSLRYGKMAAELGRSMPYRFWLKTKGIKMRKIIAAEFMTIDGVIQNEE